MVLFESGFETGDTSEWDSENGTPDIAGTYKRTGSYGMKCDSNGSGAGDYVIKYLSEADTFCYWELSFWFQLKGINVNDILTILDVRQNGDCPIQLTLSRDAVAIKLWCYTIGGETIGFVVSLNEWHKVTVKSYKDGNTTFKFDDEDEVETASTNYYWNQVRLGCRWRGYDTGLDIDVWFDDFSWLSVSCCTDILIVNAGGTLCCDAIEWRERQNCNVAVRNIPLRTTGSFVDTGTWTLRNRRLYITARFTDADKTILQAIFGGHVEVTITAGDWTYTGWFVTKPLVYEYSKDGNGNEREWIVEMEFALSSFSYSP